MGFFNWGTSKGEESRAAAEERSEIIEEREDTAQADILRSYCQGNYVSAQKALSVASFSACVEFVANTVALLPIKLYQEDGDNTTEIKDDPRVKLLNDETGDSLDSFQMKKALIRDFLIHGSGYIYINKELNTVKSLHYVEHCNVTASPNADPIFKRCDYYVQGRKYRDFEFIKLLRNTKDGHSGVGIIEESAELLATAYNTIRYENTLLNTGGNKKGFISSAKKLTKEAMDALKAAWVALYSNNENNVMVLNEGLSFKESSNTAVEMQLNENKKVNAEEICKLFSLSVKVISGLANDEEYSTAIKTSILHVFKALETALNRELLLESEKDSFYFACDSSELLKGDIEKRFKAYKMALDANIMQVDEVRYREDLKPLGFNYIKLGLQDVLLNPDTGVIYTANMNAVANLNNLQKGEQKKDEN